MKRPIFKYILFASIFSFIILLLYISSFDKCRSLNIFKSSYHLGFAHIENCISTASLKRNIKNSFSNNPSLYELARDFYNIFIKPSGEFKYNILSKIEKEPDTFVPEFYKYTKGIINTYQIENSVEKKKINFSKNNEFTSWKRSHGGNWNTKYSSNNNININNINDLELIWKHTSFNQKQIKKKWKQNIEINPVLINKNLIYVTADWKIVSLDPENGEKKWEIQSLYPPGRRGLLTENDFVLKKSFLYLPINGKIYKINSETGKRHKKFGNKGSIDSSTVTAPIIYNNFLIIVLVDKKAVNVFDKNDGRFLFQIPLFDERRNFVGGTPWGGVAFDEKNGIVFVTTGNPQPGLYGVNRKGENFRSNSIIAVDINLRKIIWEFQETFHDLWDYDVCSPPILHDLRIGDKTIETVIALTKVGNTIILERKTGKPIYDLNYKKVNFISDIPGEITSSYQLNLKLPEKFHSIEITTDDFSQLKTTDKNKALKTLKNSYYGSFYPPSFNKFLITKGLHGGAEWQGGTLDPQNQFLYIPVNNVAWKLRPIMQTVENKIDKAIQNHIGYKLYQTNCSSCHQKNRNGIYKKSGEKLTKYVPSLVGLSIVNKNYKDFFNKKILEHPSKIEISNDEKNKIWDLFNRWDLAIYKKKAIRVRANGKAWSQFLNDDDTPAINPPWGYLAKLDLTNGKIVWKKPIGMKIINGKEIQIGTPNFGGAAVNAGNIIFYTGTDDNYAYAINSKNGNIIWKYKMDAAGSAPPIIYELEGKQYVSFLSTGGQYHNYKEKGSTLYTFAIKSIRQDII